MSDSLELAGDVLGPDRLELRFRQGATSFAIVLAEDKVGALRVMLELMEKSLASLRKQTKQPRQNT